MKHACPSAVLLLSLFAVTVLPAVVEASFRSRLLRRRREWIIPPTKLEENKDHTKKDYIAKIRSDSESLPGDVQYSLTGVGADKYPFNLFVVDPVTGWVTVTGILDREVIAQYNLSGIARFRDGRLAEKDIELRIKVVDENDNAPVFSAIEHQTVPELSAKDTFIMQVLATDADEPGNNNSIIAYSIVDSLPPGGEDMFYITKDGKLFVRKPTLDRELHDKYVLVVKGADLNGRPGGKSGTGSVTVHISDVNDNLPTLEKEQYEGSIVENTQGVEVMRIKALDLDQEGTDNWTPIYEIVQGNEAGYFSVHTDPATNEGVLMLDKAVDYEDVKDLELGLAIKNVAPPHGGGPGGTGGST